MRDDAESSSQTEKFRGEDLDATLAEERKRLTFREEKWFFWLRLGGTIFIAIVAIILVGLYLWHIASPSCWRWMETGDLNRLERFAIVVVTGVISTLAISYFFKNH